MPFFVGSSGGTAPADKGDAGMVIVAASNASPEVKSRAVSVCDGTADQVELNVALAAHGNVHAVGLFRLSAPVLITRHGATLSGAGKGTRTSASQNADNAGTKFQVQAGFAGAAAVVVRDPADDRPAAGVTLRDFAVDGGGGISDGVLFRAHTSRIDNVSTHRCVNGVHVKGYPTWATYDTVITGVVSSHNTGTALWFGDMAQDGHAVGCVLYDSQTNLRISAGSQQITGVHTYSAIGHNVWMEGGSRTKIVNLKCEQAGQHGIFVDGVSGTSDVMVSASNFKDNSFATVGAASHIYFGGPNTHARPTVTGCSFSRTSSRGARAAHGIHVASSSAASQVNFQCNNFGSGHFATSPLNVPASVGGLARNNAGSVDLI